jgi:hypothetical protein
MAIFEFLLVQSPKMLLSVISAEAGATGCWSFQKIVNVDGLQKPIL